MSINNKRSYVEYTVVEPTTEFVITFEDYDVQSKDRITVTIDGVLAEEQGYVVMRKNEQVVTITPAVAEGTVRLTRETDIDEPFHKFTAGALFSAKSVDENFAQVRHSQQEVRDSFVYTTNYVNNTLSAYDARITTVEDAQESSNQRLTTEVQARKQGDLDSRRYAEDILGMGNIWDGISTRSVIDTVTGLTQADINAAQKLDTGITATAKFGGTARELSDKLSDSVSIKDFGSYGDGGDWTPALHKIAGKDLKVWLPRGTYIFKADAIDCLGQDIHFEGDDATVILERGTGEYVFNITDCESVVFRGITFQSLVTGVGKLVGWNPDSLIGLIDVQHCKFSGRISLFREAGSLTRDPILEPYGIKKFVFDSNELDNAKSSFIQLTNIPIYRGYVRDTYVTNLHYPVLYLGISNGSANESALKLTGEVTLKRNTVVTDDSHWLPTGTLYQCFALVECREVEWVANDISGMKSNDDNVSLYDAYLACMVVHSKGNTYKNNAVFNPSNTKTTLIKAKQDSIPELTVNKIFEDNTYTVEREWVERVGETTCTHKLFGIGVSNAGNVILKNLTIDIIGVSGDDPYFPTNINMQNITIIAEDRIGYTETSILRPIPFDSNATLKMKNIDIVIKNATSDVILYSQNRPTMEIWRSLEITDVDLSVGGVLYNVSLFEYLRASYARLHRNSINGVLATNNYLLSIFKELDYKDNTLHSIKDVEIQPFYQCEFFGEVDIAESLTGIFNAINLFLAKDYYDRDVRFKYDLTFEDATGITEVSFAYTIKVSGSVVTLEVLDDQDVLQTIVLDGSSDLPFRYIKTVGTSTSESSVQVRLYNLTRAYLAVQPSPIGNRGKLTMRVKSFYV